MMKSDGSVLFGRVLRPFRLLKSSVFSRRTSRCDRRRLDRCCAFGFSGLLPLLLAGLLFLAFDSADHLKHLQPRRLRAGPVAVRIKAPQHGQFLFGRLRCLCEIRTNAQRPPGILNDHRRRNTGMHRRKGHFVRFILEAQNTQRGDHRRRSSSCQSNFLAPAVTVAKPG